MSTAFSVIIPAFNESKTIAKAIQATSRVFNDIGQPYEILVVDDGSSDGTANVISDVKNTHAPIRLIRHATNQGKGAAVRTGILAAQGEWAVFLDSDLSTHPSEFKNFLPVLDRADIIIGSRRTKGSQIVERQSLYRVWAGRLFNLAIRLYLHLPYHDTQCGFKAFHRRTFPLFNALKSFGWAFDVELLLRAKAQGFSVTEVPVSWRNGRETRVRFHDIFTIIRDLRAIKKL